MIRDTDADIKKLQSLRARVRQTELDAAQARTRQEQAVADLDLAKAAAKKLGIDPDKPKKFDEWLDHEAAEIEGLLEKAEGALNKAQEMLDVK